MPKKTAALDAAIKRHWNLEGIISDLRGSDWYVTEPHRIDRMTFLCSYDNLVNLAQETVSKKEWKQAEEDGFEHEIADEYNDRLGELLAEKMGEHVYVTISEGDVFAGQYEDGNIQELKAKGYQIQD